MSWVEQVARYYDTLYGDSVIKGYAMKTFYKWNVVIVGIALVVLASILVAVGLFKQNAVASWDAYAVERDAWVSQESGLSSDEIDAKDGKVRPVAEGSLNYPPPMRDSPGLVRSSYGPYGRLALNGPSPYDVGVKMVWRDRLYGEYHRDQRGISSYLIESIGHIRRYNFWNDKVRAAKFFAVSTSGLLAAAFLVHGVCIPLLSWLRGCGGRGMDKAYREHYRRKTAAAEYVKKDEGAEDGADGKPE